MSVPVPSPQAQYAPQRTSIAELKGPHGNLMALSAREAAWLDAHHFPTPAEMARLPSCSTERLLHHARDLRDPRAAALLGTKHALAREFREAMAVHALGASLGSLYAREQLAIVAAFNLATNADIALDDHHRALVVAGLEVARMLGDHRAGMLIAQWAPRGDKAYFDRSIALNFTELVRQMEEDFRVRRLPVPRPDLRPNAEAWARIDQAGADGPQWATTHTRRSHRVLAEACPPR